MNKFVKSAMVALIAGVFATSVFAADDADNANMAYQGQDQASVQPQDQTASAADQNQQAQANPAGQDQQANAQAKQDQNPRIASGKSKCRYGYTKKCDKNGKNCKRVCNKSKKMAARNSRSQDQAQKDNNDNASTNS